MTGPRTNRDQGRGCATAFLALACAATALSCDGGGGEKPKPRQQSSLFTERRELKKFNPLKLGENCSQTGRDGCKSGVCFKRWPGGPETGFVCSVGCSSPADCPPRGWSCQAFPGGSYCVPPESWQYAPTAVVNAGQGAPGRGPPGTGASRADGGAP